MSQHKQFLLYLPMVEQALEESLHQHWDAIFILLNIMVFGLSHLDQLEMQHDTTVSTGTILNLVPILWLLFLSHILWETYVNPVATKAISTRDGLINANLVQWDECFCPKGLLPLGSECSTLAYYNCTTTKFKICSNHAGCS